SRDRRNHGRCDRIRGAASAQRLLLVARRLLLPLSEWLLAAGSTGLLLADPSHGGRSIRPSSKSRYAAPASLDRNVFRAEYGRNSGRAARYRAAGEQIWPRPAPRPLPTCRDRRRVGAPALRS